MRKKRVPGYPGLYREDLGSEGTRFRIIITRHKKTVQEYFYFGKKQSEDAARKKSVARWTEIRKSLPVVTRTEFAQIERRKSPSGTVGVRRISEETKGHPYDYWIAVWTDQLGSRKMKKFSINKYGEKDAEKLARKARAEGLAQLATE